MSVGKDVFADLLLPNEQIVCSGGLVSGLLFHPDDIYLIPLTLV